MSTVSRIFNFSAGPAVLPLAVLEEAREHLLALPGVGMSILEISHRSKPFEEICFGAEAGVRELAGVPDGYHVLFLQGGATSQFSAVPLNLATSEGMADYIETGVWSQKAIAEATKFCSVNIAASTRATNHDRIPADSEMQWSAAPAYVHMTSNNTIYGTQWHRLPAIPEGVPLVNDASSDIFCRPIDVAAHGLIYAGAQKNLSIAGLTLVIVRADLVGKAGGATPLYLDYATHAKERSLFNTPPVFAIYVLHLVLRKLLAEGGLAAVETRNRRKAGRLYEAIDGSGGFYRGHARVEDRSWMNVTFRLPSEELEKRFVAEATAAGLDGLKGHRSVGGIRASIYNAFPEEGVEALTGFMAEFQRTRG